MCGVIGGIGGLIVEVLLFIIKGSQLDSATERARKRALLKQNASIREPRDVTKLIAEAERELAVANSATESIEEVPIEDSAAGVGLETKKQY